MRKVFIDLGAWQGNSIDYFLKTWKDSSEYEIHAFEMFKPTFSKLVKRYPNINAHRVGAWDKDCIIPMKIGRGDYTESTSLYMSKRIRNWFRGDAKLVKVIDFSAWMGINVMPQDYIVLKMNIEGAEYKVLPKMVANSTINWVDELYVDWHWKKIDMDYYKHKAVVDSLPIDHSPWSLDHE